MFPIKRNHANKDAVRIVQTALKKLKCYAGTVDGDFGPNTEKAMMLWEASQNLTPEGMVAQDEYNYFLDIANSSKVYEYKPKLVVPEYASPVKAPVSGLPARPHGEAAVIALLGKPYEDGSIGPDGKPDGMKWWAANQVKVQVPAVFSFNKRDEVYVGKYIAPVVKATFEAIAAAGLAAEIKTFDGCFKVRPVRGYEDAKPPKYSTHTYAMAIDVNAATNGLGVDGDLHPEVIAIFEKLGWIAGARFKRKDYMHFQYVSGM